MAKIKAANLIEEQANRTYKSIGKQIVATESRSEGTVRDALVACLGYTPEQIELVIEGMVTAYAAKLEGLYTSVEVQTAGNFGNVRQGIWNRQSEKKAILESFRLYAGWDTSTRAAFKSAVQDAQSYHGLVSLCRATVAHDKGLDTGKKPIIVSKTVSAKGMQVTLERIGRMSLDQLNTLRARIVQAEKKFAAAGSEVISLNKARARRNAKIAQVAMQFKKRKARKAA